MGSNRFDQATNQQYVSQYTPLPLEAISNMAKGHQDRYDKAVEDTYKLQDVMANVHAIDKHQPYKQALDAKYAPLVEDISDRITKGNDLPTAERDMHRLVRQFQSDPLRQELENSYTNYNAYQKDKIAKGDKYGEHYDPYLPFTGSNPDKSIAGFRYTGMGEIQNHAEEARKQMEHVGKDASLKDFVHLDQAGNIIGVKRGYEGIASKKIESLAANKVPSFLMTKEGQDFAKAIHYRNPNADIRQAAKEYLYNAGSNQIFGNTTSGNDFKYAPWAAQDHADEKELQSRGLVQSLEGDQILDLTSPEFKQLKESGIVDKEGKVDFNKITQGMTGFQPGTKEAGDRISKMGGWLNLDASSTKPSSNKIKEDYDKIVKVGKQAINMIGKDNVEQTFGKSIDKLNGNDINALFNMYNEYTKSKGYGGNKLDGAEKKSIETQVFNDPTNYEVLDSKLQLSTSDTEDFKSAVYNQDSKFNVNSRMNVNGKSYLTATVVDKKSGEVKEVFLRPKTKEYNQYFDDVAKVSQDVLKGYGKEKLQPSKDPRIQNATILSETMTDGGKSKTVVYRLDTGEEEVIKYGIKLVPSEVKGKYDHQLVGGERLGTSFKEYQQGQHLGYGMTPEGRKMYETNMGKKQQTEENIQD